VIPRDHRLDLSREFRFLKKDGNAINTPYFTLIYRLTGSNGPRVGFIVSNKIGTSVRRNRVRRILRSVVQDQLTQISQKVEMVLIAKSWPEGIGYEAVSTEFNKILPKIRT
jgi:ribonuclease P protein component